MMMIRMGEEKKVSRHITYSFILGSHICPSLGTFAGDLSLGNITEIFCDDGTGGLHIEEEWSERTLWRIWIMLSLLSLLLLRSLIHGLDDYRACGALKSAQAPEKRIFTEL